MIAHLAVFGLAEAMFVAIAIGFAVAHVSHVRRG